MALSLGGAPGQQRRKQGSYSQTAYWNQPQQDSGSDLATYLAAIYASPNYQNQRGYQQPQGSNYWDWRTNNARSGAALGAAQEATNQTNIGGQWGLAQTLAQAIPAANANMYGAAQQGRAQELSAYYPSLSAMNVSQIQGENRLAGLRDLLAAIGPMLSGGYGQPAGTFNVNAGNAGFNWA